jgi:hypothetical protein
MKYLCMLVWDAFLMAGAVHLIFNREGSMWWLVLAVCLLVYPAEKKSE